MSVVPPSSPRVRPSASVLRLIFGHEKTAGSFRVRPEASEREHADRGGMSTQGFQLVSFMLVTTSAGLSMIFAGMKKRKLRWRERSRDRRRLIRR